MLDDPIEERPLEPDVVTDFLAFQPLMTENLLTLGKELLVQQGLPYELLLIVLVDAHAWVRENSEIIAH